MPDNGYTFGSNDFASLLLRRSFPEETDKQTIALKNYLQKHLSEFDSVTFSVRVGKGLTPDPSHLPAVQANTTRFTQKRIDMVAYRGQQPVIVEAKHRVDPSTLGQVLTYRKLWLEDHPDAPEPELVVVGSQSDDDTIGALTAHGVTVIIYDPTAAE